MADERFESTRSDEDQRRILELELVRIQKQASAARLEARAAEIELLIRQLAGRGDSANSQGTTDTASRESRSAASAGSTSDVAPSSAVQSDQQDPSVPQSAPPEFRFSDWQEVRSKLTALTASRVIDPPATEKDVIRRIDAAQTGLTPPHLPEPQPQKPTSADHRSKDSNRCTLSTSQDPAGRSAERNAPQSESSQSESNHRFAVTGESSRVKRRRVTGHVSIESNPDQEQNESRRGKPSAWLLSSVTHVAVLVLLAAISLQTQRPKDQIALQASASEPNEVSMETVQIESIVPETEPAQPIESEPEYELSPVGEFSETDFVPDAVPAPAVPLSSAIPGSQSSAAAMTVESQSEAKIQFCGVEGGGNHFVYLVDSSGSMGAGFESARKELLASIQVLKPDQRFYVVFFDAESDYMRLSNAQTDEPRSVYATAENKAALHRWAMRINMDRGRAPYDPLRFALGLKPDVIFLLSDGEFPQGIEELLKQENRVENLFGETHPISIVHTIGYHSKEGENRMRRIAEQNRGQYRYIPKP